MKRKFATKTIILDILKFLKKITSQELAVTYTQIAHVLNSLGIPCDRKTVGRNINYLIDYGYPIVKLPRGGCYYENELSKNDLNLISSLIQNNLEKFENKNVTNILFRI